MLTSLGIFEIPYGSKRGANIRLNPDTAEQTGRELIRAARRARKERAHESMD